MANVGGDYLQNIKTLIHNLIHTDVRKRRNDMEEFNLGQTKRKKLFNHEPVRNTSTYSVFSPNFCKQKESCYMTPTRLSQSRNNCLHTTSAESDEIDAFNFSRNQDVFLANGDHYDEYEQDYEIPMDYGPECHKSSRFIRSKYRNNSYRINKPPFPYHPENRCIRQHPKPKQLSPYNFIDRDKYQEIINSHTPSYESKYSKMVTSRNSIDYTHLLPNSSSSITSRIVNSVIDYEVKLLKKSRDDEGYSKPYFDKQIEHDSVLNCDKANVSFLNFRNDIGLNSTSAVQKPADISETSSRKEDTVLPSPEETVTENDIQQRKPIKEMLERTICSRKWLEDKNASFESKRQLRLQRIEEELRKKSAYSDHNQGYNSELEDRIQRSLLSKLYFEPLEEPCEERFPELSEDQEHAVDIALKGSSKNQIVAEKFNMSITRSDILTLSGLNWLNDEVINFYMNLLMDRSKNNTNRPKVYATNTFFYPKLMSGGQTSLRRWTKKVDIFAHDLMLVPIHLSVHWCMAVIDFREKTVKYYDSMGSHNQHCVNALIQYLIDECLDKKKEKLNIEEWSAPVAKNIPQQMNGCDCGVFSCTFAEFESRNASFTFSQADMPYLRRKMVYEIISGKLLLD